MYIIVCVYYKSGKEEQSVNDSVPVSLPRSSIPEKKTVVLVIVIALLTITMCAVFFSLILMLEPESEPEPDDSFFFLDHSLSAVPYDGGSIFVFDNKTVVQADGAVEIVQKNLHNTCAIYLDAQKSLYFADKNGCIRLGDNVISAAVSDTGNYVVYISATSSLFGYLFRYDTIKNISTVIDKSAGFSQNTELRFSPNGKTFVYGKNFGLPHDNIYVSVNGEKGDQLKDIIYVDAISNGGKYILFRDVDGNFFYRLEGKDHSIETDMPETVFTNRSCTEYVYSTKDSGSYVITGKNDVRKISDDTLEYMYFPTYALRGRDRILAVNHFNRKVFMSSSEGSAAYSMAYIDGWYNDEIFRDVNIPSDSYLSYNLSTFYFVRYGNIIKFNRNSPDKKDVLAKGVLSDSLLLSRNGKELFYIDLKKNLYCIRHGEINLIAENVDCAYLNNGERLYFMKDGKVMMLKNKSSFLEVKLEDSVQDGNLIDVEGQVFYRDANNLYLLDSDSGILVFEETSQG